MAVFARRQSEMTVVTSGVGGTGHSTQDHAVEQAPVRGESGIWLPVELSYNFKGRKFVFGFSLHEQTRMSDYRRIGPPAQALAQIRRELNGAPASASQ